MQPSQHYDAHTFSKSSKSRASGNLQLQTIRTCSGYRPMTKHPTGSEIYFKAANQRPQRVRISLKLGDLDRLLQGSVETRSTLTGLCSKQNGYPVVYVLVPQTFLRPSSFHRPIASGEPPTSEPPQSRICASPRKQGSQPALQALQALQALSALKRPLFKPPRWSSCAA